MRAITLLLAAALLAGCVDADDTEVSYRPADDEASVGKTYVDEARPDTGRTVSYVSESKWDGWEASPERVKVVVNADERRHTHYFESMPVAYGWLEERYGDYDIVDLLVANVLTNSGLIDADDAYFLLHPGYEHSLPVVYAYPTRRDATAFLDRYPDRYYLRTWDEVDDNLVIWRDRYWDDWRDDYGFVRTASVTHVDGRFWDGWYETPDRVLVRVNSDGRLATHYFDGLPVAWAWLDDSYDDYEIIDLQVAGADVPGRLLNARNASYLWMSDPEDALPAVLAFATRDAAASALRALGDDTGFRLLDWDDLTPRLTSWSDEHWNTWRGNPERNRGIARALEAGLGRKLGLLDKQPGVVAGEHRERARLADEPKLKTDKPGKAAKAKGDKPAKAEKGKSGKEMKSRGSERGKVKSKDKSGASDKAKAKGDRGKAKSDRNRKVKGESKSRGSTGKVRSGSGGKDKARGNSGSGKDRGGGGGGKGKGGGKK